MGGNEAVQDTPVLLDPSSEFHNFKPLLRSRQAMFDPGDRDKSKAFMFRKLAVLEPGRNSA